jgi:histidine triad (HIT) family protein
MADANCIFCKIIKKEIPAEIVYADSTSIAFLDINPVSEGHLLLIPKIHYHWMTDVPDDLVASLFVKTKELMLVLKKTMQADYIVVSVVGTDVPHFHIHLTPRFYNDGMKNFFPTKKYEHAERMKEVAEKIRQNLI